MKKLPLLFFCLILALSGCTAPSAPVDSFKAKFKAKSNGVTLKGKIYSSSNNTVTIKISYPDALSGYVYSFKNNKLNLSYNNLYLKSESEYLPEGDFSRTVYNVLRSLKKEDNIKVDKSYNSLTEYKGSCESGKYALVCDNLGKIKEISLKENNFNIKFSSISLIN
jgi:hypothetical protein